MATDRRLLELALKGLVAERDRIAYEITELRARLGGRLAVGKRRRAIKALRQEITGKPARKRSGRKKMSASQRKLISERMKQAWARRKSGK